MIHGTRVPARPLLHIEPAPPKDEFARAYDLATRVLDRPNGDPDDDLAVLARHFLRTVEKLSICVTRGPTPQERDAYYKLLKEGWGGLT